MASKYTKVPVNEAGPFSVSNNLLQLQIDDLGVSDFSESYLDLEVSFRTAGGAIVSDPVKLGDIDSEAEYSTGCFIKNLRMEAEKQPFVCEERYRNRLGETMRTFYKGKEERDASKIYGNSEIQLDPTTNRGHCLIPLSELAPIGKLMYPNYAMGKTTLKLELEDRVPISYLSSRLGGDVTAGFELDDVANATGAAVNQTQVVVTYPFPDLATAEAFMLEKEMTLTGTLNGAAIPADTTRTITAVTLDPATLKATVTLSAAITINAGESLTNAVLTIAEANAEDCANIVNGTGAALAVSTVTADAKVPADFEVGKTYNVGYFEQTSAGVAPTDQYKYVSTAFTLVSAVPNATNNANVDLTFNAPVFTLPPAKTAINLFVAIVDYNKEPLTYTVHKCDLVLSKPIKMEKMSSFQYSTMALEMVNMPQTTDWRRQYELEQECDQVLLLTPTDTLLSERDEVDSYRNAINSIDTTTEDVKIQNASNGSLYHDMLLKNLDDVKSLQPYNGGLEIVVVSELVPPPSGALNNVIEFRLSGANATSAKVVYLFKRVNKAIKL